MKSTITLTLLTLYSSLPSAFARCETPAPAQAVAKLKYPGLTENSGIDFSNKHEGIFWAINDSGNPPEIFALGIDGKNYGKFTLKGASNVDWEDISLASCFHDQNKDCLYIADFGDNFRLREEFQVYIVEEPQDYKIGGELTAHKTVSFRVKNKHNFEALAINEESKEMYFISKHDLFNYPHFVSTVYSLKEGEEWAQPLATLDFNKVQMPLKRKDKIITAADFDNETKTFLIGTLLSAFEIGYSELDQFSEKVRKIPLPKQKQGEAIAYYRKGGKKFVAATSEGKSGPLYVLSCE